MDLVVMNQRQVNVTEEHDVGRDSRVTHLQGIQPQCDLVRIGSRLMMTRGMETTAVCSRAVAPDVVVGCSLCRKGRGFYLLQSTSIRTRSCSTEKVGWCMSGLCTLSGYQLKFRR